MQQDIRKLYGAKDQLCEDGIEFLLNRNLSIAEARKRGICSRDGYLFFLYQKNGEVVRWKSRNMKNKKDQKTEVLNIDVVKDVKMPFFSQLEAHTFDYLIITEGELDCIALSQLGASNCVSLPHGAASVESSFKNNYDYLQKFERIYIAFDMDEAGEKAAQKAMQMLPPAKYRRIVFPGNCKDANDWIITNDPDNEAFLCLLNNAKKYDVESVTDMIEVDDDYSSPINLGISSGWTKLDNILGGIRQGEITVVTADTGSGKTTFCLNLLKQICEKGAPVWINSYEMFPKIIYRKVASLVLKKCLKYDQIEDLDLLKFEDWLRKNKCYFNKSKSIVEIAQLRNQVEMAVLAFGVKFVLIDHLDYIYGCGKKKTPLENIDDAMKQLHAMAMELDVGIILVVHPKQVDAGKELTMCDLKGSSSIKQYADNILILTRMDRLVPTDLLRIKIRVAKNRLCGIENFFYMRYVPEIDGYTETF